MKFMNILKDLNETKEFKKWKEKNKKSYLVAAFFVFDYEKNAEKPVLSQKQIDYVSGKNIAVFHMEKGIAVTEDKIKKAAQKEKKKGDELSELKLPEKFGCDLEDLESQVKDELGEKGMQGLKINKIIAILQMHDNGLIWNVTTIFSTLDLLTVHIGAASGKLLFSEKKNIFEVMEFRK